METFKMKNENNQRRLKRAAAFMLSSIILCSCANIDDFDEGDGGSSLVDSGIIPDNCPPGETKCQFDLLLTCISDGSGWRQLDCLTSGKKCITMSGVSSCRTVICMPGSGGCDKDGLTPMTCAKDGQSWVKGKACDPQQGMICSGGACSNACTVEAKDKQNVGCTFNPVNLHNTNADTVGVVVSNAGKWATQVTLKDSTKTFANKTVKPGALATLIIPKAVNMLSTSGIKRYAFKLTSTLPVAAYQFSPLNKAEQRSNDASMLVARPSLGLLHYVLTTPVTIAGVSGQGYFTVVGTEANTQVTVWPAASTVAGGGVPAVSAGQSHTATIGEMDLLQFTTRTMGADLTGSKIKSNKKVAVFGGNACTFLPAGKMYCDHVQEHMFPVETWGKNYVAVKFMPRGQTPENDHWRILASEDNTKVTLSGVSGLPAVPTLMAGKSFQIATPKPFIIKADKPITVGHYLLSQQAVSLPLDKSRYNEGFQTPKNCAIKPTFTSMGDPAISVGVPYEQYRKEYIFLTPDTYRYDFVTVTLEAKKENPQILLDGKKIPVPLQKIGSTAFYYARFRITDGPHRLTGDQAFGIEVYGYDCNVSYAYGGGLSLKVINPIK